MGYIYFFIVWLSLTSLAWGQNLPLEHIKLPQGFSINIYAENVINAREMALGTQGTLFVGSRKAGKVYAIIKSSNNTNSTQVITLAENLNLPSGIAFKDGALYVAEVSRILRYENIEENIHHPGNPTVIYDKLPKEQHHGWKFIAFGPDDLLYVPVGAPCNNCLSHDPRFASLMRMTPEGEKVEIFAQGIRNTLGFDWHPESKILWFTDNGRDWLGDDFPADELNKAPKNAMHFGFPYCHAGTIADPEFGTLRKCKEFTAPEVLLGPHVAALGMRFYTGDQFPNFYKNKIFIAEHGSWNRSNPIGYRIALVDPNPSARKRYTIFAQGWLQNGKPWGRPADVLVKPDGSLLISDDYANVIYQVVYKK